MELIPILATIILVATITTFFLSIGAYVLYKVREKRGVAPAVAPPATIQAELVTPESQGQTGILQDAARSTSPRVTIEMLNTKEDGRTTGSTEPVSGGTYEAAPVRPASQRFIKVTSENVQEKQQEQQKRSGAIKWR